MFNMEDLETYDVRGLNRIRTRIQTSLHKLAQEPADRCIDPSIGVYFELYGLDRIINWQGLTDDLFDEMAPVCLVREDIPLIQQAPAHLDRCAYCLRNAAGYVRYIRKNLHAVETLALDCLQHYLPLATDESLMIRDSIFEDAYQFVISMPRKEEQEQFFRELETIPCTQPRLARRMQQYGIINMSSQLLMTDYQLERLGSPLRTIPYEKRLAMLHELSEHVHVDACFHCALLYDHEKYEEAFMHATKRHCLGKGEEDDA